MINLSNKAAKRFRIYCNAMEIAINQYLLCICQQSGMDIQHHLKLLEDM